MTNVFIVSTIEKRLQELHRKLSEIAEIPKILSSTLATVSQTFDKLTNNNTSLATTVMPAMNALNEQKRKLSYDEDVYDYELSDDGETFKPSDDEEEFNVKQAYRQLKRCAAKQRKSKEVTPESDYASESNYQSNETNDHSKDTDSHNDNNNNDSDDDNDNDNDDDDEKTCDMYEVFNLPLFNKLGLHNNDHESESDTEQYEGEDDDIDSKTDDADNSDDDDDDDDFLTTTFTWNLRQKQPKLQRRDSYDSNNSLNNDDNYVDIDDNVDDKSKCVQQQQHSYLGEGNILRQIELIKGSTPDKEQKVDKMERSWPWADREKIIYKQSTCHLVPHKPLGLIEQRIQLLAKRNLLEHLNKTKNP